MANIDNQTWNLEEVMRSLELKANATAVAEQQQLTAFLNYCVQLDLRYQSLVSV